MPFFNAKGTQVKGKTGGEVKEYAPLPKRRGRKGPCPFLCEMVPANVPGPGSAQQMLHPKKDVFVLKVAKVGATGDRRCKMELELVTPKGPEKKIPERVDTRETQCDPEPPPCGCCCAKPKKQKRR